MKTIAIYLRVSTTGQDVASQEPDLKAWLRVHGRKRQVTWYRDTFTGKTFRRPAMQQLEEEIHSGGVGTVVVWRLDRLGRTASETLRFLDDLDAGDIRFVSVRDGIDSTSAAGRLLRTILAGFAEYEHEVISERIQAGIARAKASGKHWGGKRLGQRSKLTKEKLGAVRELLTARTKKSAVARQLGISRSTVYRAAKLIQS
jgi:Site-specific recombinases, DNA invertase Pin homologs